MNTGTASCNACKCISVSPCPGEENYDLVRNTDCWDRLVPLPCSQPRQQPVCSWLRTQPAALPHRRLHPAHGDATRRSTVPGPLPPCSHQSDIVRAVPAARFSRCSWRLSISQGLLSRAVPPPSSFLLDLFWADSKTQAPSEEGIVNRSSPLMSFPSCLRSSTERLPPSGRGLLVAHDRLWFDVFSACLCRSLIPPGPCQCSEY